MSNIHKPYLFVVTILAALRACALRMYAVRGTCMTSLMLAAGIILCIPAPGEGATSSEDERLLAFSDVSENLYVLLQPVAATIYARGGDKTAARLLRAYGALYRTMERTGDEDEKIAARALVGRGLLLNGHFDLGAKWIEQAYADATRAHWSDAQASGLLADLAVIAHRAGRSEEASFLTERANACPSLCQDDALVRLGAVAISSFVSRHSNDLEHAESLRRAMLARMQRSSLTAPSRLSPEAANLIDRYRTELMRQPLAPVRDEGQRRAQEASRNILFIDQVTFLEATLGVSRELADLYLERAFEEEDQRPASAYRLYTIAVGLYQQVEPSSVNRGIVLRRAARHALRATEYYAAAEWAEQGSALLVPDAISPNAPSDLKLNAAQLLRTWARALWRIGSPQAEEAYSRAVNLMLTSGTTDVARELIMDLLDANLHGPLRRLVDGILTTDPTDGPARMAKARILAEAGNFSAAALELQAFPTSNWIGALQRLHFLEKAGDRASADSLRAEIEKEPKPRFDVFFQSQVREWRDYGAYESAIELTSQSLSMADNMIAAGGYANAQALWQMSYTMARSNDLSVALRLMRAASTLAVELSFAHANDTDGGSLQLLRRDRWRYVLFIDILWAIASGVPRDRLLISSRY